MVRNTACQVSGSALYVLRKLFFEMPSQEERRVLPKCCGCEFGGEPSAAPLEQASLCSMQLQRAGLLCNGPPTLWSFHPS